MQIVYYRKLTTKAVRLTLLALVALCSLRSPAIAQTPTVAELSKKVQQAEAELKQFSCKIKVTQELSKEVYDAMVAALQKSAPTGSEGHTIRLAPLRDYFFEYAYLNGKIRMEEFEADNTSLGATISDTKDVYDLDGQVGNANMATFKQGTMDLIYGPIQSTRKINSIWVSHILSKGDFKIRNTHREPIFNEVIDLEGKYLGTPMTFTLAPGHGYLCVQSRWTDAQGAIYECSTSNDARVGNIYLPLQSIRTKKGPNGEVFEKNTIVYTDLKSSDIGEDLFSTNVRKGGKLYDIKNDIEYLVGPNGERIVDTRFGSTKGRTMRIGWLFMASATCLLLLGVGTFIQWRRRSKRS